MWKNAQILFVVFTEIANKLSKSLTSFINKDKHYEKTLAIFNWLCISDIVGIWLHGLSSWTN